MHNCVGAPPRRDPAIQDALPLQDTGPESTLTVRSRTLQIPSSHRADHTGSLAKPERSERANEKSPRDSGRFHLEQWQDGTSSDRSLRHTALQHWLSSLDRDNLEDIKDISGILSIDMSDDLDNANVCKKREAHQT